MINQPFCFLFVVSATKQQQQKPKQLLDLPAADEQQVQPVWSNSGAMGGGHAADMYELGPLRSVSSRHSAAIDASESRAKRDIASA